VEAHIRIQALALVRRGDRILVEEGRDEVKDETFFRLLGGTVEFGETGAETVRRELREELGAEADVGDLVATIENLFTYEGQAAHEICLVYEVTLRDERLYARDEWDAHEETAGGVVVHLVSWRAIDSVGPAGDTLYPEELHGLLRAEQISAQEHEDPGSDREHAEPQPVRRRPDHAR
jgi:ADP-ribose pyrophosphatase YjhB (NUDIX family)